MKFKLFTAASTTDAEKAVNKWLSEQKQSPTIHRSDTNFQTIKAGGKQIATVTVGVWYG